MFYSVSNSLLTKQIRASMYHLLGLCGIIIWNFATVKTAYTTCKVGLGHNIVFWLKSSETKLEKNLLLYFTFRTIRLKNSDYLVCSKIY